MGMTVNAQTISVDDSGFTPQQLVNLLLSTSCATNSNISISSSQSVAYFNGNGSAFPISEGIIIRSGIAANTAGLYTGNNLDSEVNTNGDPDLQAISNATGQDATITDVAFLQFDFTPASTNFSFDFLFASNEYGQYQCQFSDVFAFVLTDLNTGVSSNLAIVPGTSNPISVRNIRDNQYNPNCTSESPELFSTYNVNNASNSTLNMRGHTVVLNASSSVVPNNPYRIKLVIGDYNDTSFDSAVFFAAGSFDTTLDIGPDQELCDGDTTVLDSGYTDLVNFSYQWQLDGVDLPGETNPSINVSQAGVYDLIITTLSTGCQLTDQVIISSLTTNEPNDLLECDTGATSVSFNLTLNDHSVLGIDSNFYSIFYYASLDDANNNVPIPSAQITSYTGSNGDTVYVRIQNINSGNLCSAILEFDLLITQIQATMPDDFEVCQSDENVDLVAQVEAQILNGLPPSDFTITYHLSEDDALNNIGAIPDPTIFPLTGSLDPITIWARLSDNENPICIDVTNFTINMNHSPLVDELADVYNCTDYTLPALTNGNYFTEPDGGGTPLFAGDVIGVQSVIYIYNENAQGCSSESNFTLFMADEFTMDTNYCEQFVVPSYPNAQFYSQPGGVAGTEVPAGTIFTEDVTLYFYAINSTNNSFCAEFQFDIVVVPLPTVEQRDNVVTCDSFQLPNVLNGERYFSDSNGNGIEYFPGDIINTSQTIYMFGATSNPIVCTNETFFSIDIIDSSAFVDVESCGEYIIPTEQFGGYFTAPMGGGDPIPAGTSITTDQTIYYYAPEVTLLPNCTDDIPVNVVIRPLPPVDSQEDILRCFGDFPVLQPLVNGNYFTGPSGTGDPLFAGQEILSSQTIYIYNTNAFCDAETSFNVEIRPLPPVENFLDIEECDPYQLPDLLNGRYFDGPGGPANANEIPFGTEISATQTIYIYNEYDDLPGCLSETVFTVFILGIEVDEPEDVSVCFSYELPPLTVGDYFTASGGIDGGGTQIFAGDIITSTQTLYVYAENGDRILCSDEHEFVVNVFQEPNLPPLPDLEGCFSVDLPLIDIPDVTVEFYRRPNQVDRIDPAEYTITDLGSRIIYVYAYPTGNLDCSVETLFQVTVYPLLDLEIEGGTICVDAETGETRDPLLLESGLDPSEFTVDWYLNGELVGTGSDYLAEAAGTYVVETTKLTPDVGPNCNYNPTEVEVVASIPQFEINFLTEVFDNSTTVEIVTVDPGLGFYRFSLDNGPFQEFNRFYNVGPGTHTITIHDISGRCGDFIFSFISLDYPNFFTPNDDGVNDTWNIPDLQNDLNATIKIFNRLGRLVAEIKPSGLGWNGFNDSGKKEPSTDYWFEVQFTNNGIPTTFRGHFSLLRK
jgi:gliding motility-associated-like protein